MSRMRPGKLRCIIYMVLIAAIMNVVAVSAKSSLKNDGKDTFSHNNWAVIVCSSAYWFNYRHLSNALILYRIVKKLGIPDRRIILMNSLEVSHDSRNPLPGAVFASNTSLPQDNLWRDTIVDLRGAAVSSDQLINLLTGTLRNSGDLPILDSNENSNILIYMDGHGGDEFFKFHDGDELSAQSLGFSFTQMFIKKRYKEILFVVDTCQAATLAQHITAPRIVTVASSRKGENSFGYFANIDVGVTAVDRFTFMVGKFFDIYFINTIAKSKSLASWRQSVDQLSMADLLAFANPYFLNSQPVFISSDLSKSASDLKLVDYFVDSAFGIERAQQYAMEKLLDYSFVEL